MEIFMKNFSKYIISGKLTQKEVNLLLKDANIYKNDRYAAQVVKNGGTINKELRNSTVSWPKVGTYPKTFKVLQSMIISEYYSLCSYIDLTHLAEIQYARYETGNFFTKHRDTIYKGDEFKRAITCSINLSNSEDYTGGELCVYDEEDNEISVLGKDAGSFIIFPAFLQHEAKTVNSGIREAIVTWIRANESRFDKFKTEVYSN